MTRNNTIILIIILAIFIFALWALVPLQRDEDNPVSKLGRTGLRFGLDLAGGVFLKYETVFAENATSQDKRSEVSRAITTIKKRIDKYGVTEPVIQSEGTDYITVKLPGFTDLDAAKRLVEQTGFLEFREVELNAEGAPVYLSNYLEQEQPQFIDQKETANRIFVATVQDQEGNAEHKTVAFLTASGNGSLVFTDGAGNTVTKEDLSDVSGSLSWVPARSDNGIPLTGELLADAAPNIDQSEVVPSYVVSIEWNSQGAIIFDQIASRLYNSGEYGTPQRALGIFIDNSLLSNPQILQQQYQGSGQIEGSFTPAQAEELANMLKSGALPMPLELYNSEFTAGTLGSKFIELSWLAGIIGIVLVIAFMIAYYRLPGLFAGLALAFYVVLVMFLFKLIPVTLTLAGLGGFILSIGMAVDANVLIFERMKEEIRTGRTLGAAVETGFNRAWSAIRDSNITTIIVCIILYWMGNLVVGGEKVMGFAMALGIGVLISMFTAIMVTRTLLRQCIHSRLGKRMGLFNIYRGKSNV
jgi:protein-export membrane protein SecD